MTRYSHLLGFYSLNALLFSVLLLLVLFVKPIRGVAQSTSPPLWDYKLLCVDLLSFSAAELISFSDWQTATLQTWRGTLAVKDLIWKHKNVFCRKQVNYCCLFGCSFTRRGHFWSFWSWALEFNQHVTKSHLAVVMRAVCGCLKYMSGSCSIWPEYKKNKKWSLAICYGTGEK